MEKVFDTATLELTKAVADVFQYLKTQGVYSADKSGKYPDSPIFVHVTREFFERNFPGATDKAEYNGMVFFPLKVDCASR